MTSVRLRRPTKADIEKRQRLGFHPDIQRCYGVKLDGPLPMTFEQAESWVSALIKDPFAWTIYADRLLAGLVRLHSVNQEDKRCSVAIGLVDGDRLGRGIGSEALKLCLHYAFKQMGMHRVSLRVLASNHRAVACYEKCGFKHEGIEREAALTDFGWQDDVIMGVLLAEFKALDWKCPDERAEDWKIENAEAFKANNQHFDTHGLWNDSFRDW